MDHPRKRQRMSADAEQHQQQRPSTLRAGFGQQRTPPRLDHGELRLKLKSRFESIFEKYGKDFTGVGDEIDLYTGEIVVDNGHLVRMTDERDESGQTKDWAGGLNPLCDAFAEDHGYDFDSSDGEMMDELSGASPALEKLRTQRLVRGYGGDDTTEEEISDELGEDFSGAEGLDGQLVTLGKRRVALHEVDMNRPAPRDKSRSKEVSPSLVAGGSGGTEGGRHSHPNKTVDPLWDAPEIPGLQQPAFSPLPRSRIGHGDVSQEYQSPHKSIWAPEQPESYAIEKERWTIEEENLLWDLNYNTAFKRRDIQPYFPRRSYPSLSAKLWEMARLRPHGTGQGRNTTGTTEEVHETLQHAREQLLRHLRTSPPFNVGIDNSLSIGYLGLRFPGRSIGALNMLVCLLAGKAETITIPEQPSEDPDFSPASNANPTETSPSHGSRTTPPPRDRWNVTDRKLLWYLKLFPDVSWHDLEAYFPGRGWTAIQLAWRRMRSLRPGGANEYGELYDSGFRNVPETSKNGASRMIRGESSIRSARTKRSSLNRNGIASPGLLAPTASGRESSTLSPTRRRSEGYHPRKRKSRLPIYMRNNPFEVGESTSVTHYSENFLSNKLNRDKWLPEDRRLLWHLRTQTNITFTQTMAFFPNRHLGAVKLMWIRTLSIAEQDARDREAGVHVVSQLPPVSLEELRVLRQRRFPLKKSGASGHSPDASGTEVDSGSVEPQDNDMTKASGIELHNPDIPLRCLFTKPWIKKPSTHPWSEEQTAALKEVMVKLQCFAISNNPSLGGGKAKLEAIEQALESLFEEGMDASERSRLFWPKVRRELRHIRFSMEQHGELLQDGNDWRLANNQISGDLDRRINGIFNAEAIEEVHQDSSRSVREEFRMHTDEQVDNEILGVVSSDVRGEVIAVFGNETSEETQGGANEQASNNSSGNDEERPWFEPGPWTEALRKKTKSIMLHHRCWTTFGMKIKRGRRTQYDRLKIFERGLALTPRPGRITLAGDAEFLAKLTVEIDSIRKDMVKRGELVRVGRAAWSLPDAEVVPTKPETEIHEPAASLLENQISETHERFKPTYVVPDSSELALRQAGLHLDGNEDGNDLLAERTNETNAEPKGNSVDIISGLETIRGRSNTQVDQQPSHEHREQQEEQARGHEGELNVILIEDSNESSEDSEDSLGRHDSDDNIGEIDMDDPLIASDRFPSTPGLPTAFIPSQTPTLSLGRAVANDSNGNSFQLSSERQHSDEPLKSLSPWKHLDAEKAKSSSPEGDSYSPKLDSATARESQVVVDEKLSLLVKAHSKTATPQLAHRQRVKDSVVSSQRSGGSIVSLMMDVSDDELVQELSTPPKRRFRRSLGGERLSMSALTTPKRQGTPVRNTTPRCGNRGQKCHRSYCIRCSDH